MEILYLIGMAAMLEKVQLLVSMWNYGAVYNGLGAVTGVLKRDTNAPMVYRVLAAWMMVGLQKLRIRKLESYEIVKFACNFYALYAVWLVWGFDTVILVAMVLPVTFLYDYWDWAIEIGSIGLGMTGQLDLAIVGVILLALSRESFPLVALAYGLVTFDGLGAGMVLFAGAGVFVLLRLVQGEHKLYCKRFMWRDNLQSIRAIATGRVWLLSDVLVSLVIMAAGVAYVVMLQPGWPVVALLVVLGFAAGRIQETRVFASILPFVLGVL